MRNLLLAVLILPACAGGSDIDPVSIRCDDAVGVFQAVPSEGISVLDTLGMSIGPLQVTESPSGQLGAKSGFYLKSDRPVTIVLDPGYRSEVEVEIGLARGDALSGECAGDGWLAFPGGYTVVDPVCVGLTVSSDDDSQSVQVGVGLPCD